MSDHKDDEHEEEHDARRSTQEIVEDIRHEIEEVVEHVPKSVRWTVGKIVRVAMLGLTGFVLLVIVTALLFLANRTQWVAGELSLFLNQALALRSDIALDIRDLDGNLYNRVEAISSTVGFRDGEHPPILVAPRMRVGYSLWGFITGKPRIDVVLDAPVLHLARGPDGMMRFPEWRSGAASTAVTTYDIRLIINDGTVVLPDEQRVEGLVLDAAINTGRPSRVTLNELRWDSAPYVPRLDMARGELTAADSITFRLAEFTTPDVAMSAFGGWEAGATDEVKERHFHVQIDRLRWGWLADLFKNDALDVPGEGAAVVEVFRDSNGNMKGNFLAELEWNGLQASGSGDASWENGKITLSELDVVSPGGALRGSFEMEGKPWTLQGRVREGNPELWSAFGLMGWPEGELDGVFTYHTAANGDARIEADVARSSIAGWDSDSAYVLIRTSRAAPDSFNVDMFRSGGMVTLDAEADSGGWTGRWTARNLPLEEWPDGRATGLTGLLQRGAGTVTGADGALFVTGMMGGTDVSWFGSQAERWNVDAISGRLLPTPDLTAQPGLEELTFLGVQFDSLRGDVRLGDATLAFDSLRAFAGDTTVSMDGVADWHPEGWNLEASYARAQSNQFDWTAEAPLELRGDEAGVVFERLSARDGDAGLSIRGRWASPEGRHDWRLEGRSLDLSRLGLPTDWNLLGRADADLGVEGAGTSPRWSFDGRLAGPGAGGDEVDSVRIRVRGAEGELALDELTVLADGGRLSAQVEMDRARAWPDTLSPEGIAAWIGTAARWSGDVESNDFPLGNFGDLVSATADISGRLEANMRLRGRPAAPEVDLTLDAERFAWRTYTFDKGTGRLRYADDLLQIDDVRVTKGDVVSSASGQLPIRFSVGRRVETIEAPMAFRMEVPDGDFALIPLFVPQIGAAAGHFRMSATMGGTPRHPKLDGAMTVRDARLRLTGREEQLFDVQADITFDESRITLDSLRARQGKQGVASAAGVVDLGGLSMDSYRFDVVLRDFTALESGLYSATFDGRFVVTDGERLHGEVLPHVVGDLELLQARILLDFANQTDMAQFTSNTQPLFWTYRVTMRATNKLKWEPPNANVEFSADLTLEQTVDSLAIFGDVNSLRGRYWFLSNRFDVLKANLSFDNVGGMDPQLDIEARTQLRPSVTTAEVEGRTEDGSPETIVVRITGRSRKPELEFSSSPRDWDQPRVLQELTVGRFTDGSNVALGDPLDDYVTRTINRQLSQEMSRVFQGYVNEWAFRRESGGLFTGEGDLYAEVGIPLSTQWQIRYSQRVPGLERPTYSTTTQPLERDLEVEYRLSRFFWVTSELLQRRSTSGSTASSAGPEFNLNLKARWEY